MAAGMVTQPWDYPWSSVHAHLAGTDPQGMLEVVPLLDLVGGDWQTYLSACHAGKDGDFAAHERTGRPLGDEGFIGRIERALGRAVKKENPGLKQRQDNQVLCSQNYRNYNYGVPRIDVASPSPYIPASVSSFRVTKLRPGQVTMTLASAVFV